MVLMADSRCTISMYMLWVVDRWIGLLAERDKLYKEHVLSHISWTGIRACGYKTFFMLNSVENKIRNVHKD